MTNAFAAQGAVPAVVEPDLPDELKVSLVVLRRAMEASGELERERAPVA